MSCVGARVRAVDTQIAVSGEWTWSIQTGWLIQTGVDKPPRIIRRSQVTSYWFPKYWLYRVAGGDIIIIKARQREHVFFSSGTSAKLLYSGINTTGSDYVSFKPKYIINWSYFWRNASGQYMPAWALGSGWVTQFDPNLCDDVNLCGAYSLDSLEIKHGTRSGAIAWNYRSSWPWLTQSGIVNIELMENRSHRQRLTTRTALGSPMGWSPGAYFIFTTTGYTLWEFASKLNSALPGVSAINLDGGSSTSFYSKNLNIGGRKVLPEFFLLR